MYVVIAEPSAAEPGIILIIPGRIPQPTYTPQHGGLRPRGPPTLRRWRGRGRGRWHGRGRGWWNGRGRRPCHEPPGDARTADGAVGAAAGDGRGRWAGKGRPGQAAGRPAPGGGGPEQGGGRGDEQGGDPETRAYRACPSPARGEKLLPGLREAETSPPR